MDSHSVVVIHHSADYDGIFCREIARKFLPNAKFIGWDFGNEPLDPIKFSGQKLYVLDLPVDRVFGFDYKPGDHAGQPPQHPSGLVWIDHHASSIANHPSKIPGYRIDGVAACRLAWQWFSLNYHNEQDEKAGKLPTKDQFLRRDVNEPLAVALAGEYDVWQHENSKGSDITFQFGLDTEIGINWDMLLSPYESYTKELIQRGYAAQQCFKKRDADIIRERGFDLQFEGLTFLALNTSRKGSQQFAAGIKDHHDACLAFFFDGKGWVVGMYHDRSGERDIDLSKIAVKHGGGGHRRACGFQAKTLPWLTQ